MLTKKFSNSAASLRCLSTLSLMGLMFLAFSCSKSEKTERISNSSIPASLKTEAEKKKWVDSIAAADLKLAYYEADEVPSFPGGEAASVHFIGSNLKYPKEAIEKKKEGKVYVKFIIEEDGQVSHITIASQANPYFDQVAMDVIKKMPKWTAGKKDGKPVKVWMTVPVSFKL